jgi:hypothetical protein
MMVRKVKETLAETKARLTYELAQRTQDRISSLKVEAKAKAKRQQTGTTTGRKTTTSHNTNPLLNNNNNYYYYYYYNYNYNKRTNLSSNPAQINPKTLSILNAGRESSC